MAKLSIIMLCLINILGLGLTITTIVLASKISDKTRDNPLEAYEKQLENLFDDDSTNETKSTILEYTTIVSDKLSKLSKYCQCGEKITDNICTEQQIISGCYDASENNKSINLRYLKEDCEKIEEKIANKGGFSKAFDLNYNIVYKCALGIFIVLLILSLSIYIVIVQICFCEDSVIIFFYCTFFVYLLSLIINFILFIILIASYYKGKAGEFIDFYEDCLKGEDKSISLQKVYKQLNQISKYVMAFAIINFIHIGLHIAEGIIISRERKKNNTNK